MPLRKQPKKVVVKVSRKRLKNGTQLRLYVYEDEKSADKRGKKGSHGKAQ